MTAKITCIFLFACLWLACAFLPVCGQADHDETEFVIDGFHAGDAAGRLFLSEFHREPGSGRHLADRGKQRFRPIGPAQGLFRRRLLDAVQLALCRLSASTRPWTTAPRPCSCPFWPSVPWPCEAKPRNSRDYGFHFHARALPTARSRGSWFPPSFPTWAATPPWASWPWSTTPACAPTTCTTPAGKIAGNVPVGLQL